MPGIDDEGAIALDLFDTAEGTHECRPFSGEFEKKDRLSGQQPLEALEKCRGPIRPGRLDLGRAFPTRLYDRGLNRGLHSLARLTRRPTPHR